MKWIGWLVIDERGREVFGSELESVLVEWNWFKRVWIFRVLEKEDGKRVLRFLESESWRGVGWKMGNGKFREEVWV